MTTTAETSGAEMPRREMPRRAMDADVESLRYVLENCPGYNLSKAYKKIAREFEEAFKRTQLTLPQFGALVNTGVDEPASGSEVARRLGSDVSTVSRTMDILERRDLVEETRGEDRRVRMYRLTDAGRAALAKALVEWEAVQRRIVSELDPNQWAGTLDMLKGLSAD